MSSSLSGTTILNNIGKAVKMSYTHRREPMSIKPHSKDVILNTRYNYNTIQYINFWRSKKVIQGKTSLMRNIYGLPEDIWKYICEFLLYTPSKSDDCDVYKSTTDDYKRRWFLSRVISVVGEMYTIHFIGWSARWNERIHLRSGRIQPRHRLTNRWRECLSVGTNVEYMIHKKNSLNDILIPMWYYAIVLKCIDKKIDIVVKSLTYISQIEHDYTLIECSSYNIYIIKGIDIDSKYISDIGIHCSKSRIRCMKITPDELEGLYYITNYNTEA